MTARKNIEGQLAAARSAAERKRKAGESDAFATSEIARLSDFDRDLWPQLRAAYIAGESDAVDQERLLRTPTQEHVRVLVVGVDFRGSRTRGMPSPVGVRPSSRIRGMC